MTELLRVLITNIRLDGRTGTEVYVRDVALGLLKRGHHPVVYSPFLGPLADELRSATVPVVADLRQLGAAPDVIHGHHNFTTLTALLHFPGVPALAYIHDATVWHDVAFQHPRIHRYVAVDDNCRDRLVLQYGIPESRVTVLLNAVDLERFETRTAALPERPRRALVFGSRAARRGESYFSEIERACGRAGIALDVVGAGASNISAAPEIMLKDYDLVFGKARCALEAMAVGTSAVLCDEAGIGPLVTFDAVERLRRLNFGRRSLTERVTQARVEREIARYSAGDAARVTAYLRAHAGLDALVDQLVTLYREAGVTVTPRPDGELESRSAAVYLHSISQRIYDVELAMKAGRSMVVGAAEFQPAPSETPVTRLLRSLARRIVPSPKIRRTLKHVLQAAGITVQVR